MHALRGAALRRAALAALALLVLYQTFGRIEPACPFPAPALVVVPESLPPPPRPTTAGSLAPARPTTAGNLFVDSDLARRVVRRVCPAALDLVPNDAWGVNLTQQAEALVQISRRCPESALPFPGRYLWHSLGDVCWMNPETIPDLPDLAASCRNRTDHSRACIFIANHNTLELIVSTARAYLDAWPKERLVLLTFSFSDYCVPHGFYDKDPVSGRDLAAEGWSTVTNAMALLNHPRLLRWFTENPCVVHHKLTPVPLGPMLKVVQDYNFASHPVRPFKTAKEPLTDTLDRGIHAPRRNRKRRLLVAVEVGNTLRPPYIAHTGVRAASLAHMNAVAEDGGPQFAWGSHSQYVAQLSEYRFVWAPPGNGIDTYRAWEALLAGCIPVLLGSPVTRAYRDNLQVIEVDDFKAINRLQLDQAWESTSHDLASWLTPNLFSFYWLHKIDQAAAALP